MVAVSDSGALRACPMAIIIRTGISQDTGIRAGRRQPEEALMQRTIGVVLGALVTYLLLVVMDAASGDATPKYGTAVVVGALVSWLWPWVIGFILVRRAKQRRQNEVSDEVARQMACK
jgi:hypothetical protein